MPERARVSFAEVDEATRDVHDVLVVAQSLLNAELAPLSIRERDALATVIRLGLDRAVTVNHGLDDLREASHV